VNAAIIIDDALPWP